MGTFHYNCQIYIEDSYFKNNFGFSYGSVIHSSLTCANNKPYFIFIENCIFTHDKGKSIVYIGMEHYYIPAFLVLNGSSVTTPALHCSYLMLYWWVLGLLSFRITRPIQEQLCIYVNLKFHFMSV